jgi:hypothetical protein
MEGLGRRKKLKTSFMFKALKLLKEFFIEEEGDTEIPTAPCIGPTGMMHLTDKGLIKTISGVELYAFDFSPDELSVARMESGKIDFLFHCSQEEWRDDKFLFQKLSIIISGTREIYLWKGWEK